MIGYSDVASGGIEAEAWKVLLARDWDSQQGKEVGS